MTTITTNTAAATATTIGLSTLIARLAALMPAAKSPEALLAAQSRREAAFAATNALLR
jgi:hypothetical protein